MLAWDPNLTMPSAMPPARLVRPRKGTALACVAWGSSGRLAGFQCSVCPSGAELERVAVMRRS